MVVRVLLPGLDTSSGISLEKKSKEISYSVSPQSRSGSSVSACLNWEKSEMARFPGKFFWLSTCPCSLILPPWRRSAFGGWE